jgi:hypothetical protein
MRNALLALSLFLAASAVLAQPSPFDFVDLGGTPGDQGFVEAVREVPLQGDIHAFDPAALEHTVQRPETVKEALIRLDGGHVVTVTDRGDTPRLEPGQLVRVILSTSGPLIAAQ